MDYPAPPTYDASKFDLWKFKISAYLKALGLHVYLTTTKSSYINNGKYIEGNAQALIALKKSLSKNYLSMVSHCDSTL